MLIEDQFHPRQTLEVVGRGTVFMAIPTFYYSFLDRPEFHDGRAGAGRDVRLFTCGSAPIRAEVLPELEATLGRPVINRYGMTEAHVITSLPLDGPWPQGSVGLPLDGHRSAGRQRRRHARWPGRGRLGSAPRAEPVPAVLATSRTPPARRSLPAGSTPATWAPATRPGSSPWWDVRTT